MKDDGEKLDASNSPKTSNNSNAEGELNEEGRFIRYHGLTWPIASLFLIGDMAGGGIVALPMAIMDLYMIPGIVFAGFIAVIATATSIMLGNCWRMLQERYVEYRSHCRKPFAEMGYRAMGNWMKIIVSITINVNQFGVSVIYLLLSAKSISDSLNEFIPRVLPQFADRTPHYCGVLVILALLLLPITMLKSPQDIWWAVIGGLICSVGAVTMITVGASFDVETCRPVAELATVAPYRMMSAVGTIVFAFGGHCSFPTIQHDMKETYKFTKASLLAFAVIVIFYAPLGIFSNWVYGNAIRSSIVNNLQTVWIQQTVNFFIMAHCLMTLALMLNPLNQECEEIIGIPQEFGWKRVAVRTAVLAVVTFVGLSIPNFGPLLNLVGGSTTLATVLIFPVLFYVYLTASGRVRDETLNNENSEETEYPTVGFKDVWRNTSSSMLFFSGLILILAVVVGTASTISAVGDLVGVRFEIPCYVRPFMQMNESSNMSPTYCCSPFQNVSRSDIDVKCAEPLLLS